MATNKEAIGYKFKMLGMMAPMSYINKQNKIVSISCVSYPTYILFLTDICLITQI